MEASPGAAAVPVCVMKPSIRARQGDCYRKFSKGDWVHAPSRCPENPTRLTDKSYDAAH
jgi:hypothetical protein